MNTHRHLLKLNEILDEDLKNLKETDFMGPTTRAEWNYRKMLKEQGTDTDGGKSKLRQKKASYDFSSFDEILQQKKTDQLKIARNMFATKH